MFVAEREQGGFDVIRLAPVDGASLYAAKVCVLAIYLGALELIAVPVFAVLFSVEAGGFASAHRPPWSKIESLRSEV